MVVYYFAMQNSKNPELFQLTWNGRQLDVSNCEELGLLLTHNVRLNLGEDHALFFGDYWLEYPGKEVRLPALVDPEVIWRID